MRNCPSGPWRPWDSWIWSERAAPLAFGRVSAPPPCGVQASGGARPLGRGVSPPRRRVSFPAMGKKPKDRRGRLTSPSGTGSLRLQFVLPQSPVYGRYPYTFPQNFRRAKYGSGYDSSRATGPWCGAKFWPVPFYRRAWFRPAVAEGASRGCVDRNCSEHRKRAGRCPAPAALKNHSKRDRKRNREEWSP